MKTATAIKFGMGLAILAAIGLVLAIHPLISFTLAGGFILYFLIEHAFEILFRKGFNRAESNVILLLVLAIAFFVGILYVGIPLAEQVESLVQQIPTLGDGKFFTEITTQFPFLEGALDGAKEKILQSLRELLEHAGAIITALVTIPIITATLLHTRDELGEALAHVIPNDYFEVTMTIGHGIVTHIRDFVVAKTIENSLLALLYAPLFWLIGMPNFLFLALIAGALNIVPIVGPILTVVPLVFFGLSGGWKLVLLGLVVLAFGRLIDDAVLQTWLVAKYVNVHPLIAVIVTFVGGELLGVIGLVAAIPIYVISWLLIKGLYDAILAIERREAYLHQEASHIDAQATPHAH